MRGLGRWLGLALAGGLLLAGCGHTSASTVTSTGGAASTAATGASATGPGAPATGGSVAGSRGQTPTACVRAISKASRIAPSAKPHLEQICEKAASPDAATRRKAAHEACVELVNAARIPAGPARARALAICNAP